jgi:DNA-binding NarL/FixJ family response regulator
MRVAVVVDTRTECDALRRLLDLAGADVAVCVTTEAELPVAAGEGDLVIRASSVAAAQPTSRDPVARPALSTREQQVLAAIARGLTHAQIARRLHISVATVDTYVARIRAKLGVGNKAELTRAALRCLDPRLLGDSALRGASLDVAS